MSFEHCLRDLRKRVKRDGFVEVPSYDITGYSKRFSRKVGDGTVEVITLIYDVENEIGDGV
jgi:hypothetical protein